MIIEQTYTSSIVEKTIFDDIKKTIEVYFKGGSIYEYSDFEGTDYDAFINAGSQGSHMSRVITKNFPYRKL